MLFLQGHCNTSWNMDTYGSRGRDIPQF
jgi:hypothetical protein